MSDFFTSLAARALGAAPALAPRRASRFEGPAPAAAEAGAAWGEAPATEIASPRAAASPAAPAPLPTARPASPSSAGEMAIAGASASPVHSAEPARGEMAGPREETRRVDAIPSPEPASILVLQPMPRRDEASAAPVMGIAPVTENAPRFASPSPEVHSGEVAPASVIRVETPIVEPVRETRIVEHEREPVREVAEVRAADESPRPMPVIVPRIERVAAPAASPQPPRQPSTISADDGAEAAPVIHVSIGRIEVRAAQPAPQPRPAPAPAGPPRTSLGDYLRNSSRRRP